jgi:hypothetical protein
MNEGKKDGIKEERKREGRKEYERKRKDVRIE